MVPLHNIIECRVTQLEDNAMVAIEGTALNDAGEGAAHKMW